VSRTWKTIAIATVMLISFAAARGGSEEAQGNSDKPKTNQEQQFSDLQRDLKASFEAIKNDIKGIKNDIDTLKPLVDLKLKVIDLEENLKSTNKRIDRLQESVMELDRIVRSNSGRIARAFEPQRAPIGTGMGAIRLENRSGVAAHVFIGGADFPLGPFETRVLDNRPPGVFSYEVFADTYGRILGQVTRTLEPNQLFTIQINPAG
jgi:hypothetical protein